MNIKFKCIINRKIFAWVLVISCFVQTTGYARDYSHHKIVHTIGQNQALSENASKKDSESTESQTSVFKELEILGLGLLIVQLPLTVLIAGLGLTSSLIAPEEFKKGILTFQSTLHCIQSFGFINGPSIYSMLKTMYKITNTNIPTTNENTLLSLQKKYFKISKLSILNEDKSTTPLIPRDKIKSMTKKLSNGNLDINAIQELQASIQGYAIKATIFASRYQLVTETTPAAMQKIIDSGIFILKNEHIEIITQNDFTSLRKCVIQEQAIDNKMFLLRKESFTSNNPNECIIFYYKDSQLTKGIVRLLDYRNNLDKVRFTKIITEHSLLHKKCNIAKNIPLRLSNATDVILQHMHKEQLPSLSQQIAVRLPMNNHYSNIPEVQKLYEQIRLQRFILESLYNNHEFLNSFIKALNGSNIKTLSLDNVAYNLFGTSILFGTLLNTLITKTSEMDFTTPKNKKRLEKLNALMKHPHAKKYLEKGILICKTLEENISEIESIYQLFIELRDKNNHEFFNLVHCITYVLQKLGHLSNNPETRRITLEKIEKIHTFLINPKQSKNIASLLALVNSNFTLSEKQKIQINSEVAKKYSEIEGLTTLTKNFLRYCLDNNNSEIFNWIENESKTNPLFELFLHTIAKHFNISTDKENMDCIILQLVRLLRNNKDKIIITKCMELLNSLSANESLIKEFLYINILLGKRATYFKSQNISSSKERGIIIDESLVLFESLIENNTYFDGVGALQSKLMSLKKISHEVNEFNDFVQHVTSIQFNENSEPILNDSPALRELIKKQSYQIFAKALETIEDFSNFQKNKTKQDYFKDCKKALAYRIKKEPSNKDQIESYLSFLEKTTKPLPTPGPSANKTQLDTTETILKIMASIIIFPFDILGLSTLGISFGYVNFCILGYLWNKAQTKSIPEILQSLFQEDTSTPVSSNSPTQNIYRNSLNDSSLLNKALSSNEITHLEASIIFAGLKKDTESIDQIISFLKSPYKSIRYSAVIALRKLNAEKATKSLLLLYSPSDILFNNEITNTLISILGKTKALQIIRTSTFTSLKESLSYEKSIERYKEKTQNKIFQKKAVQSLQTLQKTIDFFSCILDKAVKQKLLSFFKSVSHNPASKDFIAQLLEFYNWTMKNQDSILTHIKYYDEIISIQNRSSSTIKDYSRILLEFIHLLKNEENGFTVFTDLTRSVKDLLEKKSWIEQASMHIATINQYFSSQKIVNTEVLNQKVESTHTTIHNLHIIISKILENIDNPSISTIAPLIEEGINEDPSLKLCVNIMLAEICGFIPKDNDKTITSLIMYLATNNEAKKLLKELKTIVGILNKSPEFTKELVTFIYLQQTQDRNDLPKNNKSFYSFISLLNFLQQKPETCKWLLETGVFLNNKLSQDNTTFILKTLLQSFKNAHNKKQQANAINKTLFTQYNTHNVAYSKDVSPQAKIAFLSQKRNTVLTKELVNLLKNENTYDILNKWVELLAAIRTSHKKTEKLMQASFMLTQKDLSNKTQTQTILQWMKIVKTIVTDKNKSASTLTLLKKTHYFFQTKHNKTPVLKSIGQVLKAINKKFNIQNSTTSATGKHAHKIAVTLQEHAEILDKIRGILANSTYQKIISSLLKSTKDNRLVIYTIKTLLRRKYNINMSYQQVRKLLIYSQQISEHTIYSHIHFLQKIVAELVQNEEFIKQYILFTERLAQSNTSAEAKEKILGLILAELNIQINSKQHKAALLETFAYLEKLLTDKKLMDTTVFFIEQIAEEKISDFLKKNPQHKNLQDNFLMTQVFGVSESSKEYKNILALLTQLVTNKKSYELIRTMLTIHSSALEHKDSLFTIKKGIITLAKNASKASSNYEKFHFSTGIFIKSLQWINKNPEHNVKIQENLEKLSTYLTKTTFLTKLNFSLCTMNNSLKNVYATTEAENTEIQKTVRQTMHSYNQYLADIKNFTKNAYNPETKRVVKQYLEKIKKDKALSLSINLFLSQFIQVSPKETKTPLEIFEQLYFNSNTETFIKNLITFIEKSYNEETIREVATLFTLLKMRNSKDTVKGRNTKELFAQELLTILVGLLNNTEAFKGITELHSTMNTLIADKEALELFSSFLNHINTQNNTHFSYNLTLENLQNIFAENKKESPKNSTIALLPFCKKYYEHPMNTRDIELIKQILFHKNFSTFTQQFETILDTTKKHKLFLEETIHKLISILNKDKNAANSTISIISLFKQIFESEQKSETFIKSLDKIIAYANKPTNITLLSKILTEITLEMQSTLSKKQLNAARKSSQEKANALFQYLPSLSKVTKEMYTPSAQKGLHMVFKRIGEDPILELALHEWFIVQGINCTQEQTRTIVNIFKQIYDFPSTKNTMGKISQLIELLQHNKTILENLFYAFEIMQIKEEANNNTSAANTLILILHKLLVNLPK